MRNIAKTPLILLTLAGLMGCFQVDMLIKVNPDGSGTIEETILMRKDVIEQMKSMAQSFAPEGEAPPEEEFSLLDEDELRAEAANFGKDVSFVRAEPLVTADYEGYKAVFAFKNINDLKVDQNPGGNLPGGEEEEGEKQKPELITFKLKEKGKTSVLTITMPEEKDKDKGKVEDSGDKPSDKEAPPSAGEDELAMTMMKEMMRGMRMSISVQVNGKIKKTNATFREGKNRITLMDMDFDKLLASEEKFREFAMADPDQVSGAKEVMKDIPGIKVETEKVVTVKFK
jgi:hypothetical protein